MKSSFNSRFGIDCVIVALVQVRLRISPSGSMDYVAGGGGLGGQMQDKVVDVDRTPGQRLSEAVSLLRSR